MKRLSITFVYISFEVAYIHVQIYVKEVFIDIRLVYTLNKDH